MVTLVKYGEKPNSLSLSEFLIDSAADIGLLPTQTKTGAHGERTCAPGSVAYTANLSKIFILDNQAVWQEV